jgi:hypothetical protein
MTQGGREMISWRIKLAHFWHYLNPFWWRRKRIIEAILKYQWEKYHTEDKINIAIRDAYIIGTGSVEVDWK